jgi:hypothetical protein
MCLLFLFYSMIQTEKQLTPQESLQLIATTIQKAKGGYHESGASAILWGSIIAFCGIYSFLEFEFKFHIDVDVWLLTLLGFIPQIYISIQERKNKLVTTDFEAAINAIWMVYGFSVFCLFFYIHLVPISTERILRNENVELLSKNLATQKIEKWQPFVFSQTSLLLLLYGIPTLATGIARKFKPMIFGGILCYVFFIISIFTISKWDILLNGFAGIFCWLIPGIILRNKYLQSKTLYV